MIGKRVQKVGNYSGPILRDALKRRLCWQQLLLLVITISGDATGDGK